MKTKKWLTDILESNPWLPSMYGEFLKVVEDILPTFDEFKNKEIHIIDKFEIIKRGTEFLDGSVKIQIETNPELITYMSEDGIDCFNDVIHLYSIGLHDGKVFYRATPESFK